MARFRTPISRTVQLGGAVTVAVLTAAVGGFLTGRLRWSLPLVLGAFALTCLLILWVIHRWMTQRISRQVSANAPSTSGSDQRSRPVRNPPTAAVRTATVHAPPSCTVRLMGLRKSAMREWIVRRAARTGHGRALTEAPPSR